jgi:hypothetical protein
MKLQKAYIVITLMVTIQSCIFPNSNQIEKIDRPDKEKAKDFGVKTYGEIVYQFYEKYGFTDIEEHLIMIVKSDNVNFLTSTLPFDSIATKGLQRIDLKKFTNDSPVNFELEKSLQEDIRIEGKEFDGRQEKPVFHDCGKYGITMNDSIETVYVFDNRTGLLYIESKKLK